MRYILAAAALTLGVVSIVMIRSLQWEGLIVLFIGGCLWWVALHLSRSAWHARRAAAGTGFRQGIQMEESRPGILIQGPDRENAAASDGPLKERSHR